jgi:hypothetical protein
MRKGQTLIIIVSVMVIALAVGVSISTRLIKNLRGTINTDLSTRTLAAAELGIENLLVVPMDDLEGYINSGSCGPCSISITGDDGLATNINVSLSFLGSSSGPFDINVKPQEIAEINLSDYPSGRNLSICINSSEGPGPLNVYMAYVYESSGTVAVQDYLTTSTGCRNVTTTGTPLVLRVKSIYDEVSGTIAPDVGEQLPSQGILLESTAVTQDITRIARAIKSYNYLPEDFDYVLYSKSETEPLSN